MAALSPFGGQAQNQLKIVLLISVQTNVAGRCRRLIRDDGYVFLLGGLLSTNSLCAL